MIQILVRTGVMKIPSKVSEKGLERIAFRDGFVEPFFLDRVLYPERGEKAKEATRWVRELRCLGSGNVGLEGYAVQVREVKCVEWREIKSVVLFRFQCGMACNVLM
jgi:hypothetical protein